jgi:MurNAc alpha-1-phosphate uridylyltransferase
MIKQAFILAAGYGTRMRPLTDKIPKPIVEVNGQSIISRSLDQLLEYGIQHIIINAFYKKELLIKHIEDYIKSSTAKPKITILEEDELLDTGGGVLNALQYLEDEPFFVVNSDSIFFGPNVFFTLNKSWSDSMNSLFLLSTLEKSHGHDGRGDFNLDTKNQLVQNTDPKYAFCGVHITKPKIFYDLEIKPTKLLVDIYSKYKKSYTYQGFYGEIYSGLWFHVGTPESVKKTETSLKNLQK